MKKAIIIALLVSAPHLHAMDAPKIKLPPAKKSACLQTCCSAATKCCYLGALCYIMTTPVSAQCNYCCPPPLFSQEFTGCYPDPEVRPLLNAPKNLALLPHDSLVKQQCWKELAQNGINFDYRTCEMDTCSDAWYSCLDLSKALYCLRTYNPCNKATASSYTEYFCTRYEKSWEPKKLYSDFIAEHLSLSTEHGEEETQLIKTLVKTTHEKCE